MIPEILNETEFARELTYNNVGKEYEGFIIKVNEIVDTSRWSEIYDLVVENDGRFYQTTYSTGATEMQEEYPFEYSEPEWFEVEPCEVTVVKYRPIKI